MPYKDRTLQRKFQNDWLKARRLQFLSGKSCERCGESNPEALEFHHRNPAEKDTHRIWSWRWERILKELEKCEILCRSCHIEHHRRERRKPILHGTYNAYKSHGCRCDKCRAANTAYARQYRAAHSRDDLAQE